MDTKCFVGHNARGEAHKSCGIACANSGIPVGVYDEASKKLYTLFIAAPELSKYMAQTVRVTGTLAENAQGILPTKIEVKKGNQWEIIELPKGMM